MGIQGYYRKDQLHPFELTGYVVFENAIQGIVNPFPWNGRCRMPVENFALYRRNHRTVRVFAKTPDLDIVNLSGAVGVMTIRERKGETATVLIRHTNVSGEGEIGAADEGEMLFYFSDLDTNSTEVRQYAYDVTVTLSDGKVYTILEGVVDIKGV